MAGGVAVPARMDGFCRLPWRWVLSGTEANTTAPPRECSDGQGSHCCRTGAAGRGSHVCFGRKCEPRKEVPTFLSVLIPSAAGGGTLASKPRRVSRVTHRVLAGEPWERPVLHRPEWGPAAHGPPGTGARGRGQGGVLGCHCRVMREYASEDRRAPGNRC